MKRFPVLSFVLIWFCVGVANAAPPVSLPQIYTPIVLRTTLGGNVRPEAIQAYRQSLFWVTRYDNSTFCLTGTDLNLLYTETQQRRFQMIKDFFLFKSLSQLTPEQFTKFYISTLGNSLEGKAVLASVKSVPFTLRYFANPSITSQTISTPAKQGETIRFTNIVSNLGNVRDSFEMSINDNSFPAGTTFLLYQSDGVTPLLDTNGDYKPDTGPLAPGASYAVIVKVFLPGNASGGPFIVRVTATSSFSPSWQPWRWGGPSATATETLNSIIDASVVVTSIQPLPNGVGYYNFPASSVYLSQMVRFTNFVNNTGGVADSYDLDGIFYQISGNSFSVLTNGAVTFWNENNEVITNTGIIEPGKNQLIYADITVPSAPAFPGFYPINLYFLAYSQSSGAVGYLDWTLNLIDAPGQDGR